MKVMVNQKSEFLKLLTPFSKGLGQIMLQNNGWTGLLFLIGICCGSLTMGLAATIAVITGTVTAMVLKYDKEEIGMGLYGFSAALVGVALIVFFQPGIVIWISICIGSALATIVQHFFIAKKIPAFTFPFILVTWLFMFVFHCFPGIVQPPLSSAGFQSENYLTLLSNGFGQVIFQDNIWSGLFFIAGVLVSRPIAAIYAMVSIVLSAVLAYQLKEPANDIYLGLLSYNAVLCAITFAGKKPRDFFMGLSAVILSVLIMVQMRYYNLPALTFPFVLASWIVLIIKAAAPTIRLKNKI